jgi:hypothetical protein
MSTADYEFLVDWNDDGDYSDTGEDITARVLGTRQPVKFAYGRDQARALSAIRAGEVAFSVNNESKDYSPDNSSSPLFGNLEPGRPVLIRATFSATTYDLFRGFLDGYELRPSSKANVSTVEFTALDLLHKLAQADMSTELYSSLQSGEAINKLLDEIGWPEEMRDIDQGATTLRWWWEEGVDGLTALKKIVDSEGPPAFAFVGADGYFVFRDRHHRLLATESTTVQATFHADTTEPMFSEPMEYNVGWRDLINQVIIEVAEREAQPLQSVFRIEDAFHIAAGEVLEFEMKPDNPFFGAVVPEPGPAGSDIRVTEGDDDDLEVTLSRTSGQSAVLKLKATTAMTISFLQVRAYPVSVARTVKVVAENAASIQKHGVRTDTDINPAWGNRNDAFAVASIIVAQRGERLPVVHITVKNANSTRLTQILSRDLSDRIHIEETGETGLDDDFFIENITHEIAQAGKVHNVTFGCEKVSLDASSAPTYFTFDAAGQGFNDGVFGEDGLIQGDGLFILGDATNGVLDDAGLGW